VVTEPDIHSADEAREYLVALRQVLVYIGACDGRMEQGSLRCEPNISVRPVGTTKLGVKAELKNLNSFRVVHLGVQAEVARQIAAIERGEPLVQETRRWDEARGVTVSMRTKEFAHDYRYFPEPDLVPLAFDDAWINSACGSLPELPEARRKRFVEQYGLPEYDAAVLTAERAMAEFVDGAMRAHPDTKAVSNWLMGDFMRLLKSEELTIEQVKMRPAQIGEMLQLIEKGTISGKIAKTVFEELFRTGKPPAKIVEEQGLTQISDESALVAAVEQVMAEQADVVAKVRAGNEGSFKFLVGQVMRATKGRANPEAVNRLLREKIDASG
jgi:aspartyl-tRNA(Asn)/glutamyl-tRNA(Gln) amidotransferase subunit B